jgi:predicted dehydrogenase
MKEHRVGIIGYGFIGKVHAHGYATMPFHYDPPPLRARITHVCTSRIETAEAGRAQLGADVATTDSREITENPDIDIVHICSPNHLHKDALLSAMAHGKHIYCDKPLVATLDEAREVAAALGDYRGTAQMTLQNRFFPAIMRAKELIGEGFLGQILEYRAAYLHAGSADPSAPLKWKLDAAAGGGVIADLASHVLDLVHHLLGDYAELFAATKIAYPDRPSAADPSRREPVRAEDCVMLLARMMGGALGHLEATKTATGTEDELRLEIHGEKGGLRFNSMDPHYLDVYDCRADAARRGWTRVPTGQRYPAPASAFPGPKFSIGWLRVHTACLANFLQSVARGEPGDPGLGQGIYIQRLIEETRRSAAEGRWCPCPPGAEPLA